jgi:hypothetical protein
VTAIRRGGGAYLVDRGPPGVVPVGAAAAALSGARVWEVKPAKSRGWPDRWRTRLPGRFPGPSLQVSLSVLPGHIGAAFGAGLLVAGLPGCMGFPMTALGAYTGSPGAREATTHSASAAPPPRPPPPGGPVPSPLGMMCLAFFVWRLDVIPKTSTYIIVHARCEYHL